MTLASACAACLTGCPLRALPNQPPLVGNLRIKGSRHVPAGDVLARLALTSSGFRLIFKIGEEYPFDPEMLRVDRTRVERIYASFGYYSARVTRVDTEVKGGRIDITFVVEEGPPTLVAQLNFQGLEGTPDWIPRDVPMKVGGVFREDGYEALKAAVVARLKEAGYWDATDTGHVVVDPVARTAAITLDAVPGSPFVIGDVTVDGTRNVSSLRVLDAAGLRRGQPLAPSRLADARHKVNALGVFTEVFVRPGEFDRTLHTASVEIHVDEAPFQVFGAGAGVEINPVEQLARLKASYTNLNLGLDLQRIVVSGSIGYAFLPDILSFITSGGRTESGVIGDLGVSYIQPRMFRWPVDALAGVAYTKDLTPAFLYQRVGAQAGLMFHIEPIHGLTFAPSIHYDYYFDVSAGTAQPTIAGEPATGVSTSGCGPNAQGQVTSTCRVGYLDARLTYDLRDDPIFPTKGAYFSIGAQYAAAIKTPSGVPITDFGFVQFNPEARGYLPIVRNLTLAARVHYGLLRQVGAGLAPPGFARFFAGGANSVRATSSEELGPRDFIVLPNTAKGGPPYLAGAPVPVGGDTLMEGSVELRWLTPLQGLGVALFFDIGSLALSEAPNAGGGWQYGPGVGFRYHTPVGPLRLDFAYRVSNLDSQPVLVDTSNISNGSTSGIPTSPTNYNIGTTCRTTAGPQAYQCYNDGRFQFFLTLGEPY